jgi:hypothetical protein
MTVKAQATARTKPTMLHCRRCGHFWLPRAGTVQPLRCANAKCRSPYWRRPKMGRGS